jgi:hypothetical protein
MKKITKSLITIGTIGTSIALITTTSIIANRMIYENKNIKVTKMEKLGEIDNSPDQTYFFHYFLRFTLNKRISSFTIENVTDDYKYDPSPGQQLIYVSNSIVEVAI